MTKPDKPSKRTRTYGVSWCKNTFKSNGKVRVRYVPPDSTTNKWLPVNLTMELIYELLVEEEKQDLPPWPEFKAIANLKRFINESWIEKVLIKNVYRKVGIKQETPKADDEYTYISRKGEEKLSDSPLKDIFIEFEKNVYDRGSSWETARDRFSAFKNHVVPFFLGENKYGPSMHNLAHWPKKWSFLSQYMRDKKADKRGAAPKAFSAWKHFYIFIQGRSPGLWPLPYASIGMGSPLKLPVHLMSLKQYNSLTDAELEELDSELNEDLDEGPVATTATPEQVIAAIKYYLNDEESAANMRGERKLKRLILAAFTGLGYFALLRPQEIIAARVASFRTIDSQEAAPDYVKQLNIFLKEKNKKHLINTDQVYDVAVQINTRDMIKPPKKDSAGSVLIWNKEGYELIRETLNQISLELVRLKFENTSSKFILLKAIAAASSKGEEVAAAQAALALWRNNGAEINGIQITAMKDLRRMGVRHLGMSLDWDNLNLLKALCRHADIKTTQLYARKGTSEVIAISRAQNSKISNPIIQTDGTITEIQKKKKISKVQNE